MSLAGKLSINSAQTTFDLSSTAGGIYSSFDSNKIESKTNFTSIRTNNCLISGKWCYEATVISNGLLQIGFCQLETPFAGLNGVGDDELSMGFDGYRQCVWNNGPTKYGIFWDCGDVIGVCIDMNKGEVEYFINGKSYGAVYKKGKEGESVVYKNAKKGENVAFFPGVSFSEGEKCYCNFGTLPFHYTYNGYEPIDIPKCHYNNNSMVTASMINLLQGKILTLLEDEKIDRYIKEVISFKVFSYLIKYSFKDTFLCKMVILPFLIKLSKDNEKSFDTFITYLLNTQKLLGEESFLSEFIDFLCHLIEEYSLMITREANANIYSQYTKLLFDILKNKDVVREWRKNTNLFYLSLRNFFAGNSYHINDIYTQAVKNCDITYSSASEVLRNLIKLNEIENDTTRKCDQILQNEQIKLFEILIDASPSLFANDIFTLIKACYKIYNLKKFNDNYMNKKNKKNRRCIKNVIYPLMKYILNEISSTELSKFSVAHFSTSNDQLVNLPFFYNEKPIGKLIFKDIPEYSQTIPNKKNQFLFNLFIRVLSPVEKMLKTFHSIFKYYQMEQIEDFSPYDHGDVSLNMLMRTFFYLFNNEDLSLLIDATNFLVKWIQLLLSKNKNNLAAMTQSVISFPFEVCNIVLFKYGEISFLPKEQMEIFINNVFSFCITILSNDSKNYRIKEDINTMEMIMKSISFVLTDTISKEIILKNTSNINVLFEMVLPLIENKHLTKHIIKIISCVRKTIDAPYLKINLNFVTNFFSRPKNATIITNFLTNFSSLVNDKMTSYINNLENCTENIIKKDYFCKDKEILCHYLKQALVSMSICINVYSFIIQTNSSIFFDSKSFLVLVQFKMFLKNLASRIINEPYIGYLIDLSTRTFCLHNELTNNLLFPIIELFLSMKSQSNFEQFSNMIIQNEEIFIQPFIDLPHNFNIKNYSKQFESYNEIVSDIKAKKHLHCQESVLTLAIDKQNEDKLCILCYSNIANKKMLPCGHVGCEGCLAIYMLNKKICFICHSAIEAIGDSNL